MTVIIDEALPLLYSNALAGRMDFSTTNSVFGSHPHAKDMFIDVLTDRGFRVSHSTRTAGGEPVRIDTHTGAVRRSNPVPVYHFRIVFPGGNVRERSSIPGEASQSEMRCVPACTPSSSHVYCSLFFFVRFGTFLHTYF
jgi:hypothetical protein